MTCEHALTARLSLPSSSTPVYKEECTQCFDNQDTAEGVDVCLSCFNGGCPGGPYNHAHQHSMKSGHYLTLNIRRIAKPSSDSDERPAKLTKLEIREDTGADDFEYHTFVRCWGCSGARVESGLENIDPTVQAVIHAVEASKGHEIKAWAEEVTACQHFNDLSGQAPRDGFSLDTLHQCSACDKRENLWLCLTCGNVGCGRRQYDGSGGNNHGISHYEATGHCVSVKLGTITPEGTADAYCYTCDDNKMDPHLAAHLKVFGINVAAQQKTEKSIAELQLDQNLKFDFSMTTADGAKLEPVAGPGLTGLKNLGNSCYMASVLQCVFGIDRFRDRYFPTAADHFATCTQANPAQCLLCQLHKLANGLWSGRYANLETDSEGRPTHQAGIAPSTFKAAVAKEHYEFSTMRQQDAFEFLLHLEKQVDVVERSVNSGNSNPNKVFDFTTEERLQCLGCQKVRYRVEPARSVSLPVIKRPLDSGFAPVSLAECLDVMTAEEAVDGYQCPECERPTQAVKSTRFASFPKVLAVQVRRFELVNWVPEKLDISVQVPLGEVSLEAYRGQGIQPGEEPLPESDDISAAPAVTSQQQPIVDEEVVGQLEAMGFPRVRCVKAVSKTGNCGAEAAMTWIFEHMDDADIDVPEAVAQTESSLAAVNPAAVEQLAAMGFARDRVERELRNAGGDAERALDRLLSIPDDEADVTMESAVEPAADDSQSRNSAFELTGFVSHKGSSVHCGHYIASVRHGSGTDSKWFMFNDSKVVAQEEPQPEQAYVYFFTRLD
ncbi:ubiquitin C-terminal hydrolase Ubp14 [Coemansia aciculifera]|uniref:Ubiquitin carboxyl-terminal hydrolase n=2 Tax=Coemansia TaxID=4863 RepID=A0A9W8ICY9_9FUNG|nr:ubiquitin C-terminal hydrolase Ubp14 [Coemansia aciculifera]KAJ2872149.1 ubiquitin C-terminal hydrolase Ubp14 [Coemansia aciculifera]